MHYMNDMLVYCFLLMSDFSKPADLSCIEINTIHCFWYLYWNHCTGRP